MQAEQLLPSYGFLPLAKGDGYWGMVSDYSQFSWNLGPNNAAFVAAGGEFLKRFGYVYDPNTSQFSDLAPQVRNLVDYVKNFKGGRVVVSVDSPCSVPLPGEDYDVSIPPHTFRRIELRGIESVCRGALDELGINAR